MSTGAARTSARSLDDPYVQRCGSRDFVWATLRHTSLIELLEADVREAFERATAAPSNQA